MKWGFHQVIVSLLLFGVFLGNGTAQERDDFLQRYKLAIENLNVSVTASSTDIAQAREEIDRAFNALRTLSRNVNSNALVTEMERVFERARTAIQNQSQTDLAVQVAVLKGGFQRLVFEAILQGAAEGNTQLPKQRLRFLAADINLHEDIIAEIEKELPFEQMRLLFEQGVAGIIRQQLVTVGEQVSEDKAGAYQVLASSYGLSLLIQDSPRVNPNLNAVFIETIQALVNENAETLSTQLQSLDESVSQLASTTQQNVGTDQNTQEVLTTNTATAEATTAAENTVVEATPIAAPQQTQDTSNAVVESSTETQAPISTSSEITEPVATTDQQGAEPSLQVAESDREITTESVTNQTNTDAAATAPEPSIETSQITAELARFGLPENARNTLSASYTANGLATIEQAVDRLYNHAARTVAAIENGQQTVAKRHIREFRATYQSFLSPLIRIRDTQFDQTTSRLINAMQSALALRMQDAVLLTGHVESIEATLQSQQISMIDKTIVSTSLFWTGFVRLCVIIILGLLAFFPIYLLNLAFGGGNRNWQLIGIAIFLLLVPLIFESLGFIGSLIANLSGIESFEILASFSIFQNTLSQIIWAVITAAAIGFATAGLYGICVQFGLLGTAKTGSTTVDRTVATQAQTTATASDIGDSTLVDWDEEL
ncbi:MAG: hypothetical protein JSV66_03800 [Trueperaceae bacterium]|nr:MAG: hypothetical protein JSV66_03800 [Trueperaceae bacterium]